MREKDLVRKLKVLKQVKPSDEWAVFVKHKILEEECFGIEERENRFFGVLEKVRMILTLKPAFVLGVLVFVFIGLFVFAQNSLPGDFLFPFKKISEKSLMLSSQVDKSVYQLQIAQKRLDDLLKVAQENAVKNLSPAIKEYQKNVSKLAKELEKEKDTKKVKEIVLEVKKLKEKEKRVKSYGIEIKENEDLQKAYIQQLTEKIQELLKDLKSRTLTERQQEILKEAQKDLDEKNYEDALLKLLSISSEDSEDK